jgi:hypothetical protein
MREARRLGEGAGRLEGVLLVSLVQIGQSIMARVYAGLRKAPVRSFRRPRGWVRTDIMTGMLDARICSRHPRNTPGGVALSVVAVVAVIAAILLGLPAPAQATVIGAADDQTQPIDVSGPQTGSSDTFWALDWGKGIYYPISATAEYVGEHVAVYLDNQTDYSAYLLNELGTVFDTVVFPTLTAAYGSPPDPGIDGESRVIILIYDFDDPMNDIDGSFDPRDIDPDGTPYSNTREVFYLNVNALYANTGIGPALAAHEFAHLLLYSEDTMLDPSPDAAPESTWLAEGFSTYGEHLCGYDQRVNSWMQAFTRAPDFNLTHWQGVRENYGASYSFVSYLAEREGAAFIRALAQQPLDGAMGIDATLASMGAPSTFASLFDDWVLSDLLDSYHPQLAPYLFAAFDVTVPREELSGAAPFLRTAKVQDFGAVYVEFPAASPSMPFQVVFDGADRAPLHAALISWDSRGELDPQVDGFDLGVETVGGTVTGPLGYDRHTLAVWSRGVVGSDTSYSFTYSGTSNPPGGIQFLDVGGDDRFYDYIGVLLDRGIVSGREVPLGSGLWFFGGKENVLRAQFAKMIMEATELHTEDVDDPDNPKFVDVPPVWNASGYPYDYVQEAASLGIVTGYSAGRFGPYSPITRSQLVLMISRAADAVGKPFHYDGDERVFADVPLSHPYYHEIMAAYSIGILSGSLGSNGRLYFNPYSLANRYQVAKMTANLLAYLATP